MKAVAVFPRAAGSVHLADLPKPSLSEVPGGRGVLIRLLRCGVDGTDKEIAAGEYGAPPPGSTFLVMGHENFGSVESVGENVTEVAPGDCVVATVRRPGRSIYDAIGTSDMSTDDSSLEHGINLLHGFLTEYSVENADFVVRLPPAVKGVGVLLEPLTIAEKGIAQAFEIQRRLRVWKPKRAAVMGAGTIGLLATLVLRLRGIAVTAFGRTPRPYLNSDLLEELGARYVSTKETALAEETGRSGPYDIIFEATGFSPIVFESMQALAKNGVLICSSVTGGDRQATVPADKINLGFVLGNKVMVGSSNANRDYFEAGVRDMEQSELQCPGWLGKLLTHPVRGLENYRQLFEALNGGHGVIKAFCEIAP